MTTPTLAALKELREEQELLNTMADAERSTPTPENRQCTNDQTGKVRALMDRIITSLEQPDLSDEEIEAIAEDMWMGEVDKAMSSPTVTATISFDKDSFIKGLKYRDHLRGDGLVRAADRLRDAMKDALPEQPGARYKWEVEGEAAIAAYDKARALNPTQEP